MFLTISNDYMFIQLELWHEGCKITQNISRREGFGQVIKDLRPGKGIPDIIASN
jgi:hypothetical protein